MSLAVCDALMRCKADYSNLSEQAVRSMQSVGRPYPHCGYGGSFRRWMYSDNPKPYNSYGNGAAMRVSGCGYVGRTIDEVKQLSRAVTEVTHNHPEGLKGAEATAVAVFLARTGKSLIEIQDYIIKNYYPLGFTLDSIRETYRFNETCQDTVPQALEAFFESTNFEDAIRNAISIGGDSDTLAAITGSVAEAYYGVPTSIRKHALTFLDERLLRILLEFENRYPAKIEKKNETGSVGISPSTGKKVKTGGRAEMMESAMDVAYFELAASTAHPEETTSQKLFSHLFEACNILRGPINQDEYKSYVTPILFFKRLSDVYDEETQVALEESGGDEEYASFAENHRFVIPDANSDKLQGIFGDGAWTNKNRLPDRLLKDLLEHFSTKTLSIANCPEDELGQGYEYLIKKFADDSGHTAQEFYTNRTVVHLMTEMLKPESGESIYDPTCGSAGMLISAIAYLKAQGKEWRNVAVYGQEINALTSAIGKMNLFLHGVKDFSIVNGDTLASPAFIEHGRLQQFDLVLANPPYSISQWDRAAFESDKYGRNFLGVPPQGRADYAFLQHIIASLKEDTGRCAILFPHGVLFRNEESAMRERLVRSDRVECVIGLGPNLFYNSPMEACIMICRMTKRPERRGQVLFINAINEVERKNAQSYLEDRHIQRIATAYKNYCNDGDFARIATIQDIADNNFSLSIPLYVKPEVSEDEIDNRTVESLMSENDTLRVLQLVFYQNKMVFADGEIAVHPHFSQLLGKGGAFYVQIVRQLLTVEGDIEFPLTCFERYCVEIRKHSAANRFRRGMEAAPGKVKIFVCRDRQQIGKENSRPCGSYL